VITGGISYEPTAFYAGLQARAPGKYDAVAVHCYGPPVAPVFRSKSIAMRRVLGGTPLWCTEWGNNQTSEAAQAADIGAALDDNDANDRYDRNYLFQLDDETSHYHLMNANGTLRQAALLLAGRTAP